ncbi:MAG: VWA domain-containing protein [Thermoanaerobaculia bacterium]|nr:VWA domain-containing protein [Thermoanaerobaculia bacterium]
MGHFRSAAIPRGLLALAALIAPLPATATELPPRYWQHWLEEVDLLMTPRERTAFDSLADDDARFDFRHGFWRARDPQPQTPQNETRDRWDERVRYARAEFGDLAHPGARYLLALGKPPIQDLLSCGGIRTRVFQWPRQPETLGAIFVADRDGPWERQSKREAMLLFYGRRCAMQATRLGYYHPRLPEPDALAGLADVPPATDEWLVAFLNRPPTSGRASWAELRVEARSRSVDRARLQLALDLVPPTAGAEAPLPTLLMSAEVMTAAGVVSQRRRFFAPDRGRVSLETDLDVGPPGPALLVLELVAEGGAVLYRDRHELVIPGPDREAAESYAWTTGTEPATDPSEAGGDAGGTADSAAAIAARPRVRIAPLPDIVIGSAEVEVQVTGAGVHSIGILLDDRPVAVVERPPYRARVDFGTRPRSRRLAAVAYDLTGTALARAAATVNASGPIRVELEVAAGPSHGELPVTVRIVGPDPDQVGRVEIYAGEELAEVLESPPFAADIEVGDRDLAYVRAVAHLSDGRSAEGVALVGIPGDLEQVEVEVIEIYATVLDPGGGPVRGLGIGDFELREDGSLQELLQVDTVESVPLDVALLMDVSASMEEGIDEAKSSALRFLSSSLREADEAAFFTFNHEPRLVVPLTHDLRRLEAGVLGVGTWGGTALWDTLTLALYYLQEGHDRRAIIVLTDGLDADSEARFHDVYESAVRSGTAVFAISIVAAGEEAEPHLLEQITRDTGGAFFRVKTLRRLESVYERIRERLHLQYRLAYQSPGRGDRFRRVDVRVLRPGLTVRATHGYYP